MTLGSACSVNEEDRPLHCRQADTDQACTSSCCNPAEPHSAFGSPAECLPGADKVRTASLTTVHCLRTTVVVCFGNHTVCPVTHFCAPCTSYLSPAQRGYDCRLFVGCKTHDAFIRLASAIATTEVLQAMTRILQQGECMLLPLCLLHSLLLVPHATCIHSYSLGDQQQAQSQAVGSSGNPHNAASSGTEAPQNSVPVAHSLPNTDPPDNAACSPDPGQSASFSQRAQRMRSILGPCSSALWPLELASTLSGLARSTHLMPRAESIMLAKCCMAAVSQPGGAAWLLTARFPLQADAQMRATTQFDTSKDAESRGEEAAAVEARRLWAQVRASVSVLI